MRVANANTPSLVPSATRRPLARAIRRAALLTLTATLTLVLCEFGLRLFFAESNGAGVTIAAQRWLDKYWTPINALGYRDTEPNPAADKRILWVIGDSYAAGWGIKNVENRFPNRLAARLGPDWIVHTIAKPGWDTRRQTEAVKTFPIRPDAIIHAYCLNDADRAASEHGLVVPRRQPAPAHPLLATIVARSHLANLIWWRLAAPPPAAADDYWKYIHSAYEILEIWTAHRRDLAELFTEYHRRTDTVIAFVIPNLLDVRSSQPLAAQVNAELEALGAATIDLIAPLADRPPAELVVNRFDPHANESVHALIADRVFDRLTSEW